VNIDVSRNDPWNINKNQFNQIQFNKSTEVLAMIINENIPDHDLCKFIVNAILFFRQLNIQHLIIYDYQGNNKIEDPESSITEGGGAIISIIGFGHYLPSSMFRSCRRKLKIVCYSRLYQSA
jgi:hypothetical protein